MNIVDALIIVFILLGGFSGWRKGFTKEVVTFVGMIAVVVLAFFLKNPISTFLYEHLPFFSFGGLLKGVTPLNILLYEIIALILAMSLLIIVLKILTMVTSIFEKLLNFTIVLGIPSKILGMIVGFIEGFVWVFIILYILNLPVFNIKELNESKYKDDVLTKAPILSSLADDTVKVIEEFTDLKEQYKDKSITIDEFNYQSLDVFLKYNVITVDSIETLEAKEKLKVPGLDELKNKYKEAK